jgi:NAD(P)-dependent dehydrogenase (short-subunit alcohol dehydrogenase family)
MNEQIGNIDAVICAAGATKFAPLESLSDDDFAFSLASKLMDQVNLVRCSVGHVTQGGSLTLTSAGTPPQWWPTRTGEAWSRTTRERSFQLISRESSATVAFDGGPFFPRHRVR